MINYEYLKPITKSSSQYIIQRFLDLKRKKFLELKQGNKTVVGYEIEFVRLSQYVAGWVQTELEMCKCFEEGLNEDIKLLIGIIEIREFAVLVGQAKKAEELNNERKQAKRKARVASKRSNGKTLSFSTKKARRLHERSTSSVGYSGR